ncbi:MAG: hypothetical protein ACP5HG_05805 [Anaerolineae bacterium]
MILQNGDQLSTWLLPLFIALVVGIVVMIAWLIWAYTRRKEDEPALSAASSATPGDDAGYFLGLKRSQAGGWEVHVQGRRYGALTAVPDDDLRAEVLAALRSLASFARDYVQQQQARHEEGAAAKPAPASVRRSVPTASPGAELIQPQEPLTRRVASSSAMIPTIDLAQEIGEIVDELLMASPSLRGRSVKLTNLPRGGISIAVDGAVYQDVDDIPDAEIRGLIRQATKEWERR